MENSLKFCDGRKAEKKAEKSTTARMTTLKINTEYNNKILKNLSVRNTRKKWLWKKCALLFPFFVFEFWLYFLFPKGIKFHYGISYISYEDLALS